MAYTRMFLSSTDSKYQARHNLSRKLVHSPAVKRDIIFISLEITAKKQNLASVWSFSRLNIVLDKTIQYASRLTQSKQESCQWRHCQGQSVCWRRSHCRSWTQPPPPCSGGRPWCAQSRRTLLGPRSFPPSGPPCSPVERKCGDVGMHIHWIAFILHFGQHFCEAYTVKFFSCIVYQNDWCFYFENLSVLSVTNEFENSWGVIFF